MGYQELPAVNVTGRYMNVLLLDATCRGHTNLASLIARNMNNHGKQGIIFWLSSWGFSLL